MSRLSKNILTVLLMLLTASTGLAQGNIKVSTSGVQPTQVKLGGTATIELKVKGTQNASLQKLPRVDGLRMSVQGPSQRNFISYTSHGRVQETSVSYTVIIEALRKGVFQLPPMVIMVGGTKWTTKAETLTVVEDFTGRDHGWLEVKASQEIAWVHQPVRLTARFGVTEEAAERISQGLQLQLPWMEKLSGTVVVEKKGKELTNQDGQIVLVNQERTLARRLGKESREGRPFYFFEVSKTFLPTEPGTLKIGAGFLTFKMVTSYRRGIFGDRVPAAVTTCTIPGEQLNIKVRTFPEEGRPDDYTGAVGRFVVSAVASPRDVVVGESIKLDLMIKGEGNLGFFQTPKLPELDGFRFYGKTEEQLGGLLRVTYDLAPLRADLKAIPALSFSYFDTNPEVENYRVERTAPIPIKVRPLPEGAGLRKLKEHRPSVTPGIDDIMGMKDFDPARPMSPPDQIDPWLLPFGVGGPFLFWLIFLSWWKLRAKRLADPAGVRRRVALSQLRAGLAAAEDPAAAANAFYRFLADLWRSSAAAVQGGGWQSLAASEGLDEDLRNSLAAIEDEVDRSRYCPAGEMDCDLLKERMRELGRELDRRGGGK